ncbi:tail fiber domain-containing protein [Mesorhizobium huakuii]|uniref:Tail fiber domain-containing protein n=1 Tax=Mesorhizobium huakuii TaxID=28104 RepID=A0A7G6T0W1_9HYPH|nr:tail fiber domain-containing protein [Mesorhizobium huakuii]QND60393.1 tail fiber domain-containing protein [Mesorhizobium huakuii]
MGTALASAGAENAARTNDRDKGLALKADVANLGRGLPAQSAQAASLGLGAGSSAVGLNQGTNAQFLQSTNIMNNGFGGAQAGYAGQASALNSQYGTQVQAWNAQQQADAANSSGIGSFLGSAVGIGLRLSDPDLKTEKTEIPEGTALKQVMDMPVEQWKYKPGVEDGGTHVGPYSDDFQKATGKGDGHSIDMNDVLGVTMKAVQDLAGKVEELSEAIGLGGSSSVTPIKKKAAPPSNPDAIGLGVAA